MYTGKQIGLLLDNKTFGITIALPFARFVSFSFSACCFHFWSRELRDRVPPLPRLPSLPDRLL